jgi:hypothetical protein
MGRGLKKKTADVWSGTLAARDYKLARDCVFCAAKEYQESKRPVMIFKLVSRRETDKI